MASSNIKLFDENKGNMLSDSEFNISTQRLNGLQTGVASSQLQNKAMYQASLVAYAIAQVMLQNGKNANDTDAVSAFVANLSGTMLQKVYDLATTAEAQAGVATGKWMSPALVKAAIDSLAAKAQNILSDNTKALYGLPDTAVPDDVLVAVYGFKDMPMNNRVMYKFTSSGTFVAPSNMLNNEALIVCVGGGGAGRALPYGGPGGGSGDVVIQKLTLLPGTSYSVVVGAGGQSSGSAGGQTTFGNNLVVASGGESGDTSGNGGNGYAGGGARGVNATGRYKANGGTGYKGGGGGGSLEGVGGSGGVYGGRGGDGSDASTIIKNTDGTMFKDPFAKLFPYVISNFDGKVGSYDYGAGAGGYGGNGGNGKSSSNGYSGAGGGGYGGNGGDGYYETFSGGGGGGGYGGNGGKGKQAGGGGGGGFFGDGGDGATSNNYSGKDGANGSGAGGGGGYDTGGAGKGGSGLCLIFYQEVQNGL